MAKKSKKKSSKKKMSKKTREIIAGLRRRKPTGPSPKPKKKRRKKAKSATHSLSVGSKGTERKGSKGRKRYSTKVKIGRVGAKVSCPAGATLITSSVTRKKKDPKTGKVKKLTYVAGQCVMM